MRSFLLYSLALVLLLGLTALIPDEALLLLAGLPAHPLLVHGPVVLLPLGVLGLALLVLWPRARAGWHRVVLGVLAIGAAGALLAKKSGEALNQVNPVSETHQQWGDLLALIAPLTLLVAIGFFLVTLYRPQRAVALVGGALALVVGAGSLGLTVAVGHSGAESVWASNVAVTSTSSTPKPSPSSSPVDSTETSEESTDGVSLAEVAEHATLDDCWTAIDGQVYDLSDFAAEHPGGASNIARLCGIDGSALFQSQHGGDGAPQGMLGQFLVGPLVG